MANTTISHYVIVDKLGEGGMGVVYKAHDPRLNRFVALKLLPPSVVENPERRRRFIQEAQAASALNHPSIVTIHDIGEAGGTLFMAMEYVAGRTLSEVIPSGGMRVSEAVRCAVQIADALAKAHAAGIVHRDLKPGNLIVTADGLVKVLDFGLAKLTERSGGIDPLAQTSPQTATGVVLGTPAYMSPEQAAGDAVDARSDIFSFGAVLYEMVTGRRPFQRDSLRETVGAILNEEPKPLPDKVPPELAKVILRCLRKDPARRFQTAADLRVALEDSIEEPSRATSRSSRWIWIGAAIVLLLVALFAWQQWRDGQPEEPLRATSITTLPGVENYPSLSPDGRHVAFAWADSETGQSDIYVQLIGSGSPLRLTTDPRHDFNPVWSPDGRWIAFLAGPPPAPTGRRPRELRVIAPLGGPERKLADIHMQDFFPAAAYLAWSADSRFLVVTDSPGEGKPEGLFVVSVETGEKKPLTNPRPPALADTSPAISPDGRSLVFLRRTSWGSGELHLLRLSKELGAAGEPKRLTDASLRADYPAWIDDDEIVFSSKNSLWRLAVAGSVAPARIPYIGEDGSMPAIARADGGTRLVYVRSFVDTNIWRVDTSSPPRMAISSSKHEYHCKMSPDGRRIAFTSSRSGDPEIWLADPDGANAIQLTSMRAQETMCAHWSPDGRFVAFSSNMDREFDLYVVPAAGGKPRRLTSHPAIDLCPTYSRDGRWIYFGSTRSGGYRVWKMPSTGGDAAPVTAGEGSYAVESPRGDLYYTAPSVVSPWWLAQSSGGPPSKVVDGVLWFNFWPHENGAYYIDRHEGATRLQHADFATNQSTTLAHNLGEVTSGLTATPDGRTIFFTRIDASADDLMMVENFR